MRKASATRGTADWMERGHRRRVAYGRLACNGLADALLARHANSCAVHDDGAMQEDADLQIHTLTAMG